MVVEPNKMLRAVSCIGIIPKMPYMQLCCHFRLLVCNAETLLIEHKILLMDNSDQTYSFST